MLSLNLNSDLPVNFFRDVSRIAEMAGYSRIWVGESIAHGHSFPLLATAAEMTNRIQIGAGIVSPVANRCHHIIQAFRTLREAYGDRFAIALAPGDADALKSIGAVTSSPVAAVIECLKKLKQVREKEGWRIPIYVGASGPELISMGSEAADGVLLNYVYPEYVHWAIRWMKRRSFTAVYGPALLLPDPENEPLLLAAARVVFRGANKAFLKEFGMLGLNETGTEPSLHANNRVLLEKFTIAGDSHTIVDRIQELFNVGIDEVILATPMCRNINSVKRLPELYFLR